MRSRCVYALIACAAVLCDVAYADELVAPRLVGMGQAGAAAAWGLDALGTNPSMMGRNVRTIAFSLYPFSGTVVPVFALGHATTSRFTSADLDLLLARLAVGNLSDVDKGRIVDAVDLAGLTVRTEGMIAAMVLPLGSDHTIGVHVAQRGAGKYTLMDGMDSVAHNVAVSGNVFPLLLRTPVTAEGVWFNEYAASYAYSPVDERGAMDFGVGVTVKFVQGLGHVRVDSKRLSTISLGSNPITGTSIQTAVDYDVRTANGGRFDANTLPVDPLFSLFPKGVGSGAGADIGLMKTIVVGRQLLTAALSVTDIGEIRWSTSPAVRSVHRMDTIQTGGLFFAVDSLKQYEGKSVAADAYSTSLPTRLHLAVALEDAAPSGILPNLATFEYAQGLTDAVGNPTTPRIAAGAEWRKNAWHWSTGLSFSADESVSWSVGGGLQLFNHLDVQAAFGRVNGLWENPMLVNAAARLALTY